jgi:uncharacterized membrane protein YagU involved in acid resistance
MNAQARASQSIGTSQILITGAIAGMVAGAVMAMYAMFASATFLHQGFFTPLYGIASPIAGMGAMITSMQQGFYFNPGAALIGLVVHMMWAAGYGIVFLLIARAAHLHSVQALIGGLVFGVAVEILMSLLVLPLLGLGGMPGTIGVPSFTIEHLLFGAALGVWVATRPALR